MADDKPIGEGDREADRKYREDTRDFVKSGKVRKKAEEAKPQSDAEAEAMKEAEEKGLERAKEKDPQVERDYSKSGSR